MTLIALKSSRPVDLKSRHLSIRLAETPAEVEAAQRLRYEVFVEEMGAGASPEMRASRREFDRFDSFCDHLLVLDSSVGTPGRVVATYRFLRRAGAAAAGGFYSAAEFDLAPLVAYPGEVMELGRSCVAADHRSGAVMQLLWRGIAAYVLHYRVDLLFGCGSLQGTDPAALALPLSYLHHHHLAPSEIRPRALSERYVAMDLLPSEQVDGKLALHLLPPLVKGYLRLGGFVGDGAVIDREFGTTDVCVVVKTDRITESYRRHLTRQEPAEGGTP